MGTTGRIVVPIKQVPASGDVKMDEKTGTMIREGARSVVNPLDLHAIEAALQLREKRGGSVGVLSMGPKSAEKSLREALAMGCDDATLVTGPEFAGSDTWATAYALSAAVRMTGAFDLVIAGEKATDGETGHVGPGIASFLDLPLSTYTSRIVGFEETRAGGGGQDPAADRIVVERMVEDGYETLRLALPALLTVTKEINFPRLPTLRGKQRAKTAVIRVLSITALGLGENDVGLRGSPTRVLKLRAPKLARGGTILAVAGAAGFPGAENPESAESAVDLLADFIEENRFLQ